LIRAAYQHVLGALVKHVGAAVEEAGPARGPEAYIREMIGHLRRHPSHTRMIIEAITHEDEQPDQDPAVRWQALAGVLAEAREANGLPPTDQRTAALVIGGAIDALVAEHLRDPSFETAAAAEELIELVGSAWRG
ncbi:MAG TPA: TetR/AcrR family transcriptional regulator, partial [Beutenbergiaceae bacterium]|nr:TetR/AcrR family transcriptional regulator [Beutenbergiaceae bacterium]